MSNDNNGSGLLGGLVLGAGFAGLLLAPFYIAYRFGVHVVTGAAAVVATALALFSAELVAMAPEMQNCGFRCVSAPVGNRILEMDKFGWWTMAGVMCAMFILTVFAAVIRQPVTEGHNQEGGA